MAHPKTTKSQLKHSIKRSILKDFCVWVLWFEVVVNLCNGIWTFVDPRAAMHAMTAPPFVEAFDEEAGEVAKWFVAVGMALGGFLLARVLLLPPAERRIALPPVLEALIVGDVLYLGSLFPFTMKYGSMPGILAPYLLTLLMFSARIHLRISGLDN